MPTETIVQVATRTYNLKGDAKAIKPAQEFINRAIMFDQSFVGALTNQLFQGSGTKILNCLEWCKHYDMMYQVGQGITNNMRLNTVKLNEPEFLDKNDFLPIAWLRIDNFPVNATTYPRYFSVFLNKYFKRLFGDRKALGELMKQIETSPSIADLDDAFLLVGLPLNRSEPYCMAYYWSFFIELIAKNAEMTDHATYLRYYVGNTQFYKDTGRYAMHNGEEYYCLNDILSGRSIAYYNTAFILQPNYVKFTQLNVYWDRLIFEGGLTGNLGKDRYRVQCTSEVTKEFTRHFKGKVCMLKINDSYYYLVYRENVYIGDYFTSEEEYYYGNEPNPIKVYRTDIINYYDNLSVSGWFGLAPSTIEDLINRDIIHPTSSEYIYYNKKFIRIYNPTPNSLDYMKAVLRNEPVGKASTFRLLRPVITPDYDDSGFFTILGGYVEGTYVEGDYVVGTYVENLKVIPFGSQNTTIYALTDEIDLIETITIRPRTNTTLVIDKQRTGSDTIFDRIIVTGLHFCNSMLYGGRLKSFNAFEGRYWNNQSEEGQCPFILPVFKPAFRRLSALQRNGASQFMFNLVFNIVDIQEIEYKWYEGEIFQIVISIVAIAVTVISCAVFQQYYTAGGISSAASAIAGGASVVAGTSVVTVTIINLIIKAIISILVQVIVAKIVSGITGNELLGNIVGAIAGMFVASMVSYGTSGFTFNSLDFSASNLTKMCNKALFTSTENILKYQQKQLQAEVNTFQNEVNQWSESVNQIAETNKALISQYLPEQSSYSELLEYKLWKYMCDPYTKDFFMYLGSDFSTAIDVEQRFVYNFAEDSIKLPDFYTY